MFCDIGILDSNQKVVRNEVGEVMWGYIISGMDYYIEDLEFYFVGYWKLLKDVKQK